MATPSINGYVSTSNYFTPRTGENDNLCLAGINLKKNKLSISLGAGVDTQFKPDTNGNGLETSFKPSFEAKAVYQINKYLNTQARFREIGDAQQYRVTFGGSYKINDVVSVYAAAHATTKQAKDSPSKTNFGAWLGTTFNLNKSLSISTEIQQNIVPHQEATLANPNNLLFNVMMSWKF